MLSEIKRKQLENFITAYFKALELLNILKMFWDNLL